MADIFGNSATAGATFALSEKAMNVNTMTSHDATKNFEPSGPYADEALALLVAGNQRFLRGESHLSGIPRETIADLARGQKPIATILGCSDSRVPPELIFDAGLGELFVMRVVGNVFSAEIAGSLQYAGSHLQTPLFVVLGHEGCGAVGAALATEYDGVQHRSRIQILVDSILPAMPEAAGKSAVTILPDCCTTVSEVLHQIALHAVSTRVRLVPSGDML